MTIKESLAFGALRLSDKSRSAILDAEVLLMSALGKKREYIYSNTDRKITVLQFNKYKKMISRREKQEPISYITGKKEFFGMDFFVDKNVLIPRPETEELVEKVLGFVGKKTKIADVGTGSGCIAIVLAKKLPKAKFIATDNSKAALQVAKKNARAHKVSGRINFKKTDFLQNVPEVFDVIVSNPPYVEKDEELAKDVLFEPKKALYVYDRMWEKLILNVSENLRKDGKAFLEISPSQKNEIKRVTKSYPHLSLQFENDLSDKIRFAILKKQA